MISVFSFARRNGKAFSRLAADGGGIPGELLFPFFKRCCDLFKACAECGSRDGVKLRYRALQVNRAVDKGHLLSWL